ncbi:MAG TPA: phosphoribosylamine--glycine ligase [Candidatus Deferrimicrobiaceae bacterium]|nr:phosphoribosylamine--glycine ligase [Candidatus Deferrimicrobiaceae bacterium]
MGLKILVVGSGGREHALVWKLAQSPLVEKIFAAPGNPGMGKDAELVPVSVDEIPKLVDFAVKQGVDLTVVGPEAPLAAGITDDLTRHGLLVCGPSKAAAQLEGSKVFTKNILAKYGIPTADFRVFDDYDDAEQYVLTHRLPVVIKADGLAAGKGVAVAGTYEEAIAFLRDVMENRVFGAAGERVVVEECLTGEEASYIVFTDGEKIVPLPSSQDHKRIGDGDTGPNTGGMGAYSPAPVITPEVEEKVLREIFEPLLAGMRAEGAPFRGILYGGLMIEHGQPKVLEFNVRFGDPEAQPLFMRLSSDLVPLLVQCAQGKLTDAVMEIDPRPTVCIVMASGGYPGSYRKGFPISGIAEAEAEGDVKVFHAGTAVKDGKLVNNGGRVLGVTAAGDSIRKAIERGYRAVGKIRWEGAYYRTDIGKRALLREGA